MKRKKDWHKRPHNVHVIPRSEATRDLVRPCKP